MRFSASTCHLGFLVATLVLVTTSFPQRPPRHCVTLPATSFQHDIEDKLVKRDSETPARVLEPREESDLICGRLSGGGQTKSFQFVSHRRVIVTWIIGGGTVFGNEVVQIMRVKQGPDPVVARANASYHGLSFVPIINAKYYIRVSGGYPGEKPLLVTWTLSYSYEELKWDFLLF
ncbi:hypothetical protein MMC07_008707 [Pseudocyphellaria aurata]|nr:hypothetical protein [Pseudocyphellaria aurata]